MSNHCHLQVNWNKTETGNKIKAKLETKYSQNYGIRSKGIFVPKLEVYAQGLNFQHLTQTTVKTVQNKSENVALKCDQHRGCTRSSAETGMMEILSHPKGKGDNCLGKTWRLELIKCRWDQHWCLLTCWSFVGRACKDLSQMQTSPVQMRRD